MDLYCQTLSVRKACSGVRLTWFCGGRADEEHSLPTPVTNVLLVDTQNCLVQTTDSTLLVGPDAATGEEQEVSGESARAGSCVEDWRQEGRWNTFWKRCFER